MKLPILIVEDEALIALGLSLAADDAGATVVGPVATVAEALALVEQGDVGAAVLDANLRDRDVTPLALCLIERGVPFVVHTGTGLPPLLAQAHAELPVVMKPTSPAVVVATLLSAVSATAPSASPIHGAPLPAMPEATPRAL